MSVEAIIAERVHRHNHLQELFTTGTADEINRMISDEFEGWLQRPEGIERYDADGIRNGNQAAAKYYEGKPVRFAVSGLTVLPLGPDQAAASYQILFQLGTATARALVLEVWRQEQDGEWRVVRWFEAKTPAR